MKQNPVTSSWLQAPVFEEDAEKTRRAQLVNFTSISLTGMAILLLSGMILSGNPFDYVTLNICLGILSGVVHYILIRRGLVNFVSLSQLILGFIYTTAIVTCLGTVNTPVSYGFLVFTVGAGILFEFPGLLVGTLSSLSLTLAILFAQNNGLLPTQTNLNQATYFLAYVFNFSLIIMMVNYAMSTSRKALAQSTMELRARERTENELRKLTQAIQYSPIAVKIVNLHGKIEYANPYFSAMTGFSAEEVKGQNLRLLQANPASQPAHKQLLEALLQKKEWRGETINRRKDGSIYHEAIYASPVTSLDGSITHFVILNEDITARKQAEMNIQKANLELERALRLKDEFLANMSHELRTPLNAIIGISDNLEFEIAGPLTEKQHQYVHTIRENGHHLLSLINDILDLAKIEAGKIYLTISETNLNTVCQSGLRMVKELAFKKRQIISYDIDPDLQTIQADERRLKQMIVNLLSNAVKFTPEGGNLGLEVRADRQNRTVNITVWDNGIGIDEKDIDTLFRPFTQINGETIREQSGTGLGLALVRQMARLHGGGIKVKSAPGIGSRFTIALPFTESPKEAQPLPVPATNPTIIPNSGRILLIEDIETNQVFVRDYLEAIGYQVELARNGPEGLISAGSFQPQLILMDLQMPGMNGFTTTQRLRSLPEFLHTPIIALTAMAMPGERERCLEMGMNEYISKPVNLRELEALITQHIQKESTLK